MSDAAEISLAQVIERCREREARLAYEIGAFVVFEACEAVLESPCVVRPTDVWIAPTGETRVDLAACGTSGSAESAASLARLLAGVLVVAGQEVPAMLLHLVDVTHAERLELAGYRDELEAALVPLNRAAARRVLSRQLRELARPRADASVDSAIVAAADADLDALLGYEAPASEETPDGAQGGTESAGDVTSALDASSAMSPGTSAPDARAGSAALGRAPDLTGIEERRGGAGRFAWLGVIVIVGVVVVAYLWFGGAR
ncbi:MAG: hypothetical protein KC668_04085 [Myxococcales bacterium]|nr:hypothetical protein [Myxococcales bacterium]